MKLSQNVIEKNCEKEKDKIRKKVCFKVVCFNAEGSRKGDKVKRKKQRQTVEMGNGRIKKGAKYV